MTWACMPGKGPGEMAVITSSINAQVYIEILDTFVIPLIESRFHYDGVIFPAGNASCHRAKYAKAFLLEGHIYSVTWPANSEDFNPTEN